jgi:UDP-N-acetylmuramoyl-tripeptide--D-alanyl-D-alanine ligase
LAKGTLAEAVHAMNGQLIAGSTDMVWSRASIDSRRISGGELFFALRGTHTDGHRFVPDAVAAGAAAAVVDTSIERPANGALILVDDSLQALHDLTESVRRRLPEQLVAVTGSAGKTTTKDLLALLLGTTFRVASTPGNFNNLYGFPLSLLAVPEETEWMVAEMGMSTPGELSRLSRLGRPNVVVLTNVRPAHLEFFGSLRKIAEAKAEILEGLDPGGLLIANADDPEIVRIAARYRGRVVRFALSGDAEYRAIDIEMLPDGTSRFTWIAPAVELRVHLPLFGLHNVANFLAASACAVEVGVSPDRISRVVEEAVPAGGRGEIHHVRGATVVDDSYNSNPEALSSSLRSARSLPGERHWAILGDMLELGDETESFHRAAGVEAVKLGFSLVLGVGELSRSLVEAVADAGGEAHWYASSREAARAADERLRPEDVLLVKASRGVGLDLVVRRLLDEEEGG